MSTPLRLFILGVPMGPSALVRWARDAPDLSQEHDHGQEADAEAPGEAQGLAEGQQEGLLAAAAPRPM